MKTFYDYKKAVISNGSVKGIYKNKGGQYCHLTDNSDGLGGCWIECNPADHLETLEDFLTRGLRLVNGDKFTCPETGSVCIVGVETGESRVNERDHDDRHIYVVKAAADQVETPEEKEAFDRIPNQATIDSMNSEAEKESYNSASEAFDAIDTTMQQVDSLGKCQEFSDGIEWENGELASLKSCGAELRVIGPDPYSPNHIFCLETVGNGEALYYHKSLLETPAEREERERLEAAYDLYLTARESTNDYTITLNQFCDSMVKARFLAIVDKTGYRKQ